MLTGSSLQQPEAGPVTLCSAIISLLSQILVRSWHSLGKSAANSQEADAIETQVPVDAARTGMHISPPPFLTRAGVKALTYPVLCFPGSPLQAFLQPLPDAPRLAELLHQPLCVAQLLGADDGLQGQQVPVQSLLEGWHRQVGQRLLVQLESAWDLV